MTPKLLRTFAITLALVAAADPSLTSTRRTKPHVAIVAADSAADSAAARRVARTLARSFTTAAGPVAGAAGTVIVGDRLPATAGDLVPPVFAVLPEHEGPTVTLEAVQAPSRAPLENRVPITAVARVAGAAGRRLEVTLHMGRAVVDRVEQPITGGEERLQVLLGFVPTAPGAVALRVMAAVSGAASPAAVDIVLDVRERRWAVLSFDRRPSWMATFVRRAIERDPRFVVTSRVVTSRGISTDAGRPPATLADPALLALYDAIVIGAPEALTDGDVAALDAYLRRHGGGVVLLFDRRADGPYRRLTDAGRWAETRSRAALPVDPIAMDAGGLRASDMIWPARLPAGAEPLAQVHPAGDTAASHPVVWRSAVGAGRLVVSGALDAWHFRDPSHSAFEAYWQTLIATTADATPRAVEITVAAPVQAPGEWTDVTVMLRDAMLAEPSTARPIRAALSAAIESPDRRVALRLWPDGPVGQLRGSFRAPLTPGTYRVAVSANGARVDAPVVVAPEVARPAPPRHELLSAWVSSRGGVAAPISRVEDVRAALARALVPRPRRETWHPMRSAWWIVPFALALGGEWWWRRRRGLK